MFAKDHWRNAVKISGDGSAYDGCCDKRRPSHA